jgi:succinoglycan biosynthesis protein ExoA
MALVSIIVPCYNEESTIRLLLDALCRQTWNCAEMEVILADGMSSDRTREEVAAFQRENPCLKVCLVDNPKQNIPAGLNRALEAAQGEIVVRLDAHSVPAADYVERCVDALKDGVGDNVGGVWEILPGGRSRIARSIAVAAAHPFGVGDALYRYATETAEVDTVPFGAFKRETLNRIGFFDETLLTNEDYELNARLRQMGGRVWLDPKIRSGYFARPDLPALAKQYFRYGFWKWRMLQRYPKTLRWRQALPPVFVLSIVGLVALSTFWDVARILLLMEVCLYFLVLAAGTIPTVIRKKDLGLLIGVPFAIATMHISWGSGFLISFGKAPMGTR